MCDHDPQAVISIDDADLYDAHDLLNFVKCCRDAKLRYVMTTDLPFGEIADIGHLDPVVRPVKVSLHTLTAEEIRDFLQFEFVGDIERRDASVLAKQALGLTAVQLRTLFQVYRQTGSLDAAYEAAFRADIDQLFDVDFNEDEAGRHRLNEILIQLCRAGERGVTPRMLAARTGASADECEAKLRWLRKTGLVVKAARRSYRFATMGILRLIRDRFDPIVVNSERRSSRWSAASDGGARITTWSLDMGKGDDVGELPPLQKHGL